MSKYIISIDQSTQGTKAMLFDEKGRMVTRTDRAHEQIISPEGHVSHDAEEIYQNIKLVIKDLLEKSGIKADEVAGLGISNQRETTVMWDRNTGKPLNHAVVWQCNRAEEICEREEIKSHADLIRSHTGITLSPYFPAAKMTWLLEHTEHKNEICLGTVDAYLLYRLTGGQCFATDYSNASRTQLFNIYELKWDEEICGLFGVDIAMLPEVKDSNALFGQTTVDGLFEKAIPIHAAMGDSHAALFGQNCRSKGLAKATYGTGSSIMMNIGATPIRSRNGLVTSIAWGMDGRVEYVLEGNLNYTGAVITWLKDDAKLIDDPDETEACARQANPDDSVYLIPAFSGLGAPYWKPDAKAALIGMDRTTTRNEIVRAGLECIAYQITDVIQAMEQDIGDKLAALSVDGGPTKNQYLMQFQSDIACCQVKAAKQAELSGIGAAFMAGLALGIYTEEVFDLMERNTYSIQMDQKLSEKKYAGWKAAVKNIG